MESTKTVKPNQKLRSLMEKHPDQTRWINEKKLSPSAMGFMNALAKIYGNNQEGLFRITVKIAAGITHTADETAAILGVTKRTLMNYTKTGKITGSKIGGKWVFTEQQIKDFINRGSVIDKG